MTPDTIDSEPWSEPREDVGFVGGPRLDPPRPDFPDEGERNEPAHMKWCSWCKTKFWDPFDAHAWCVVCEEKR